jgi:hypothetical protein
MLMMMRLGLASPWLMVMTSRHLLPVREVGTRMDGPSFVAMVVHIWSFTVISIDQVRSKFMHLYRDML